MRLALAHSSGSTCGNPYPLKSSFNDRVFNNQHVRSFGCCGNSERFLQPATERGQLPLEVLRFSLTALVTILAY
jgi:hypothetical protein